MKAVAASAKQNRAVAEEATEEGEQFDQSPLVAILWVEVWVEAELAEGLLVGTGQHRREAAAAALGDQHTLIRCSRRSRRQAVQKQVVARSLRSHDRTPPGNPCHRHELWPSQSAPV